VTHSKQLEFWAGEFGREYTERNAACNFDPDRLARMGEIFKEMLSHTSGVRRILEVGCNTGHNLSILRGLGDFELVGVEPQDAARAEGARRGVQETILPGDAFHLPFEDGSFDLVLTTGVMMHISPDDILRALAEFRRVSRKCYFTMDYFEEAETAVSNYHGHDDLLWRRDMRKVVARSDPGATLLWERCVGQDRDIGKQTWAFLFAFGGKAAGISGC